MFKFGLGITHFSLHTSGINPHYEGRKHMQNYTTDSPNSQVSDFIIFYNEILQET